MSTAKVSHVDRRSTLMFFEQDGKADRVDYTHFRGEHANFHPQDESFEGETLLPQYFMRGLAPSAPFLEPRANIVAFGSCFAGHISKYLAEIGFEVPTAMRRAAYVAKMGDGIVNTFAIRQQFEWAWEARQPAVPLWHGYDAKALGYDEEVRADTRRMFDGARAFIVTLGLSEIWYDEPTGEVFWRAVPIEYFDPARHKFRIGTYQENLSNLQAIYALIRRHRPGAAIVFTLSPIPLKTTFRPIPCVVADAASKAVLRAALDEFHRAHAEDRELFYFPSYEIALRAFQHPFMEDRRHVHKHVLDLNMATFEHYFCATGLTEADLLERFRAARSLDRAVAHDGHWAVPRANLTFHRPPADVKLVEPSA